MTDFLFSFLITKFYSNFENILSIPNDIPIYIEIPNEYKNFLQKFKILNFFIENNNIKEMKLKDLKDNFEESNIDPILNILNQIYSKEEDNLSKTKDLLFKCLNIENPTFYQIEIFCKCIKSYQINSSNQNKFLEKAQKIIKCIKLFTQNPYSDFIIDEKKDSLIDILTNIDTKFNKNYKDDILFKNRIL